MNTFQVTVRATVRYIGTPFAGWQIQPQQHTVQGEIERALSQIGSQPVRIHGAGRTDAGVHALAQVFSFSWDSDKDLSTLRRSLTRMLSPGIQITAIDVATPDFHARKSAVGKKYWYTVSAARETDPLSAPFAWVLPHRVDLEYLRALCARFVGTRDFAGFQSSGAEKESTVRALHSVELVPGGVVAPVDAHDLYTIRFHGGGFLYKMVRNITGTLIDVARGSVSESRIDELLASHGPYHGYTAPAHGLTLVEVLYENGATTQHGGGQYSAESLRTVRMDIRRSFLSSGAVGCRQSPRWFGSRGLPLDVGSGLGGTAFLRPNVRCGRYRFDVLPQMIAEGKGHARLGKRIHNVEFVPATC